MKDTRSAGICAAVLATMALTLAAPAAVAQALGSGSQACAHVHGRLDCTRGNGAAGGYGARPYERWDNGSPASGFGSGTSTQHYFPHSWGGYSTFYGFGR